MRRLFDDVLDGELLTVRGASLFRNGTCLASGRALEAEELEAALAEQRSRVTDALESFADNTMRYLREEGRFLSEGVDFPALAPAFATGTRSSSPAGRGTSVTCGSSGPTSETSSRC